MRIKTVFDNAQLCHVWANQSQPEGRNSNRSLYFQGDKIYSYGSHYLAAQIHTIRGKKVAFINNHNYSMTTCKHLSDILRALRGLMDYFYASDPSRPETALTLLETGLNNSIAYLLERNIKIENKEMIKLRLEQLDRSLKSLNDLRRIFGKKPVTIPKRTLSKIQDNLESRLKRYNELNTPEMKAKREEAKAKREEAKAKRETERQAKEEKLKLEKIERFRNGENVIIDLPYELLRVDGDTVVTSRGAKVPLSEAKAMLSVLMTGQTPSNLKIGDFTFNNVTDRENDKVIAIGCHRILLSEAMSVILEK